MLIGVATTKGAGGRGGSVVAVMSALIAFVFCGSVHFVSRRRKSGVGLDIQPPVSFLRCPSRHTKPLCPSSRISKKYFSVKQESFLSLQNKEAEIVKDFQRHFARSLPCERRL
jgi:hypothetical protein